MIYLKYHFIYLWQEQAMSIFKKLPWVSLSLVLVSYSTLGWVLSETPMSWPLWIVVVFSVLIFLASLTAPLLAIANYSNVIFDSGIKTFVMAVIGAFLFFLMLAWFRLFLDTLLIFAAAILARIDFYTAGFKEGQTLLITSLFSLTGIACGKLLHSGLSQYTHLW